MDFLYLASKSPNLLAAFQTTFSLAPLIVFSMLVSLERLYEASSPSNINNEQFYLQFDFGVGSSEISLIRDVPACCVQPRRIIPLDGHIPCCHSFMSDSHVCVVFDNLKKTQPRRSFLRYGSRQTKHIRAQCKSLKNFLYCGSYVSCQMVSVYRNLLR